jgi:glycosyltransferase involved in cell wall biosynthesis
MELSVVICTKNEERNIGRCLKAVEELADEIIVVDSFSADRTREICEGFPKVKFIQKEWSGFSDTKNYANAQASGKYILSLDADEEISEVSAQAIKNLKGRFDGVYRINRLTNYCGFWIHHSGWFPDRHLRLFPAAGSSWQGQVHETLHFQSDLPVNDLPGVTYHYSYYTLDEHWSRINTYSTLGSQKYEHFARSRLIFSMLFNTHLRFLRHYFFKFGFLDGFPGLVIAVLSAGAVFLKYAKAYASKTKTEK